MDYSIYIQEYLEEKYRTKLIKTKEEVIKLKKKKFLGMPTSEFGIRNEIYEYINIDDIKMGFEISGGCVIFTKNEFIITDGMSKKYNVFPIEIFKDIKIERDGIISDSVMLNGKRIGNFNRQSIDPFNQIQSDIISKMFAKIESDKDKVINEEEESIEIPEQVDTESLQYYYSNDDENKKGPFSLNDLESETIKRNTLIWNENLEDWTPASEISELKNIILKEEVEKEKPKSSPPPLPPPPQNSKTIKKPKEVRKETKSSENKPKTKTTKKVISSKNKGAFIKELDNDLKKLQQKLKEEERKDSMYSGGIIKAQIRQLIASIKLNINYLQTVQLLVYFNSGENLSQSEIANLNKTINSNKKTIDSDLNYNKRFKGALISVNNEQLNLCLSVINLNKVLISKLGNQKPNISESQLKKSIGEGEKLSAKYSPCLVKTNIDMRVVIDYISLNTIRFLGGLNINEKEVKTAIKKDETEIAKYKPSLYPILLSTRKVTNQILLISYDACSESEISKIKSENNKELKKISSEIKKYAPSTFKYVLAIQNEYCEYLNNL